MKKNIYICISVLNIVIAFLLGYFIQRSIFRDNTSRFDDYDGLLDQVMDDQMLSYKNETLCINDNGFISGENIQEIPIGDLNISTHTLILRYSMSNCTDCIKYILDVMKNNTHLLNAVDVNIFGNFQYARDAYVYKKVNNLSFNVYCVKDSILPLDEINTPYLFLLNKDHKVSHVFIPRKEMHQSILNYLNVINEFAKMKSND